MESSKALGGSEECSSSESGWTMYIASPIHEDSNDEKDDEDDDLGTDKKGVEDDNDDDDESDDSMASDASSGPSHPQLPYFKHGDQSKCSSGKKPYKQVKKKIYEKSVEPEKELPGNNANTVAGDAYSGAKARKTKKMEKK